MDEIRKKAIDEQAGGKMENLKGKIKEGAGKLTGVIYANGDVSVCEAHKPIGNLRDHSFMEIWRSEEARVLRRSIAARECHCTTEVFLWPSITFQPLQLARAMVGGRVWSKRRPLPVLETRQ